MSWRINVNLQDNSKSVSTETGSIGYTSIVAEKGPNVPVKLANKAEKEALELFGYPSVNYPAVQDVIDYLYSSGELWVVAPTSGTNELYGGILVREGGTEQFISGQSANDDTFDFTAVNAEETVATGDGVETIFTYTIAKPTDYNNTSLIIKVDGTELTDYTISDADPEVITATELTSGSYDRTTGEISLEFSSAVADGSVITAEYNYDVSSDTYFALFDKYPSPSGDKAILVEGSNSAGAFNVGIYLKNADGNFYEKSNSPQELSIVSGDKNAVGSNIDMEVVLENDNFITAQVNNRTFNTFTDDTAYTVMTGGSRGDTPEASDTASGYEFAQDTNTYPVDMFWDTNADSTIATTLETMRTTYNKYARVLLSAPNQSATDHLADTVTSKYSIDNRGVYVYALNWGIHKDKYNDAPFLCSNMGLIAGKHADIIQNGFGGYSPSWIQENGFGGQLGSAINKFSYGAPQDELRQLQAGRLNAVVNDFNYGPMIMASRTTLSVEADYSYIEHSGLADYLIKTIRDQVLPFVIKKPNDNAHRVQVRTGCETILGNVTDLLEDYSVKCDAENNNDEILAQKKFITSMGIIFTPFSKQINFNFVNSPAGTDIEEAIG